MKGYYLYGFVSAEGETPTGLRGVGGGGVERVALGDIAAVVESLNVAAFKASVEAGLEDRHWLTARALEHERVVASFNEEGICPLRFGSLVPDHDSLERLLRQEGPRLKGALARLQGAAEWTVRIWAGEKAFEERLNASSALQPLHEELAGASAGKAYLLRRKLDEARKAEAQRQRRLMRQEIAAALLPLCRQGRSAERLPPKRPGTVGIAEFIVLIDRDKAGHLDETLERLEGLQAEMSGPFAPYSFVEEHA